MNPAQRDAASTLSGPLLVLAGAGTGKTRVITHRIVELVASGVRSDRILSVTFTNKAAKEMLERTNQLFGRKLKNPPTISTFHSYCVRVLRQEIELLGYPKTFTIYDRGDQESTARKALREVRIPDSTLKPGDLINMISRWKMVGISAEQAIDYSENDLEFLGAAAFRKYQKSLQACGAVDFDDLLLLTNQLFEEFPEALARQQSRFDHVQIDEYQDTNGTQFDLIEALVRPHQNICVVGDDDQSIYGWRGAEVTHILNFQNHFKGAKVVRLEENYRCTDDIIYHANRLVRHNKGRHDKQLRANKKAETPVRFREYDTEQEEAENVVREIKYLIDKKGVPSGDFCILFRTNEQPRVFEQEMRRNEIRYVVMGTQSFFDKREIKDILSYLRVLENPLDENALLRIINVPARSIGDTSVQKILKRAVREGCSLFDAVPGAIAAGEITHRTGAAIDRFRNLLDEFRGYLQAKPSDMARVTEQLLDRVDYQSEIAKQYKNEDMQLVRQEIVEQMIESLRTYAERAEKPSLSEYLEETALNGFEEQSDKEKKMNQDAVKLMTMHSAKGLEFPRVYMVGMEEGLLPHKRAVEADGKAIEEERRLAYVGVTRARDFLTLTRAMSRKKWGKQRLTVPSRFLAEMRGDDEDPSAVV